MTADFGSVEIAEALCAGKYFSAGSFRESGSRAAALHNWLGGVSA
jgi:hypothetical protein